MASRLLLAMLLLHTPWVLGAPLPVPVPAESGPPDPSQPEMVFASQLLRVAREVSMRYVRPIDHRELICTAMTGLYEAARLPLPPRLREDVFGTRLQALTVTLAVSQSAGVPYPWQAAFLTESSLQAAQHEQNLIELLCRLRAQIGNPETLQGRQALVVCCQAMTKVLDPHSTVVTAESQRTAPGLDQDGTGVGLELAPHQGGKFLRILSVYPGSPAQQAGLRPDDRITHLNGKPVSRLSEETVSGMLSPPPCPVRVTYLSGGRGSCRAGRETQGSAGASPSRVSLTPQRYEVEYVLGVQREEDQTWNYWVDPTGKLAHVRLTNFGRGSAQQLGEVLERLQEEGVRGLILDLRWCPGGYLVEAVDVAKLFLPEGNLVIAQVQGRNSRKNQPPEMTVEPGPFSRTPLVVLVNGETVGGAELIAAALQDHKRGVICGQRTVGKGSVQEQVGINPMMGMKLTAGIFLRPSGKGLQRFPQSKDSDDWGVCPERELELPVSADFSKALRCWWLLQSLRPAGSNERLPLDDPSWDPQREVALQALRELVQVKTVRAAR